MPSDTANVPAASTPDSVWNARRPTLRESRNVWNAFRSRSAARHIARYERVLGTCLELQIIAESQQQGGAAEAAVLEEVDRLERIFSVYRADSELSRWQETHARPEPVSSELAEVLMAAEEWRKRTNNAFHPAVESLTRIWREAAERGTEPDATILMQTVREMQEPLWEVSTEQRTATRWTRLPVTLHAIAKGFILDRACQAATEPPGVRAALVNIGGDIRQMGGKGVTVGVADPFAPQENADLLDSVWLHNKGMATSGNYRRGFQVGNRWYSHLLDPRTGYPVQNVVSASVIGKSALLADVLATAFSVLSPDESLHLADGLPGIGTLLVSQNGERHSNAAWRKQAK